MPRFILDNLIGASSGQVLIALRVADLQNNQGDLGLSGFDAAILWDPMEASFVSAVQGQGLDNTWTWNADGSVAGICLVDGINNNYQGGIQGSDPMQGGTIPNGDIVLYLTLHLVHSLTAGTVVGLNVDDSGNNNYDMIANNTGNPYNLDPYQVGQIKVSTARPSGTLSIGDVTASAGQQVTVPVLWTPDESGGPGLDGANAALLFDPNFIDPTSISVVLGSLFTGAPDYNVSNTPVYVGANGVDSNKYSMGLNLQSGPSLFVAANRAGSLWLVTLTLLPGVSGSTQLILAPHAKTAANLTTTTNLTDTAGKYALVLGNGTITIQ